MICILEGRAPSRPEEEGSDRAEPSKRLSDEIILVKQQVVSQKNKNLPF